MAQDEQFLNIDLQRVDALRNTGLLDSPREEAFDRLTRLASKLLNAPISLVSLVDAERQFFKSAFGLSEPWNTARETPLTHSFCQYAVNTGEPLIIYNSNETPLVQKNLAIRDLGVIAYAGVPLKLPSGHVLGSFCAIDTQPRQWTESEINTLKDLAKSVMTEIELKLALQAQQEILASVSHDLKNPLSAILLQCQIFKKRFGGSAQDIPAAPLLATLATIERAAKGMHQLVVRVLDRARIDYGLVEIELEEVEASGILQSLLDIYTPIADSRQVGLRVSFTPPAFRFHCDELRIRQILSNLLSNAIRFSKAGGTVNLRGEADRGKVEFSVSNTGQSIPSEQLPHIFQRYWRMPGSHGSAKENGMGLYIVAKLVKAHGGTIEVRCASGETTFTVRLPRLCEEESGPKDRAAA